MQKEKTLALHKYVNFSAADSSMKKSPYRSNEGLHPHRLCLGGVGKSQNLGNEVTESIMCQQRNNSSWTQHPLSVEKSAVL